jgi:anti-sigma regulatory factor (Ser/Thr protein kinase)
MMTGDEQQGLGLSEAFDYEGLREHSAVERQTVAYNEFVPSKDCVGEVRLFVADVLAASDVDADYVFECQLVADELAANAVLHAQSNFSVAVELTESFVRIAVRDDSNEPPVQQHGPLESQHGRGLIIVSGTASGWGTIPLGRGKETWADVPRPSA